MSTSYYRLKPPITSILAEEAGGHTRITLWINHANTGTLTLRKEEVREFVKTLFDFDGEPILRTHWGGERGSVVTVMGVDPQDAMILISEYGEILSVKQIKSREGMKRSDGMPTELFGYEEAPKETA